MSATISTSTDLAPPAGGGFLLEDPASSAVSTPEDFTEEQLQIAATADRFMNEEVFPHVEEYENQKPGLARTLMAKSGELGLLFPANTNILQFYHLYSCRIVPYIDISSTIFCNALTVRTGAIIASTTRILIPNRRHWEKSTLKLE